jgi:hypothetical protein
MRNDPVMYTKAVITTAAEIAADHRLSADPTDYFGFTVDQYMPDR